MRHRAGCYVFRAVVRVGHKRSRSKWGTKAAAESELKGMLERRDSLATADFVSLKEACQDVLDTVRGREGTWRSYDEHFQTLCNYFDEDAPLHAITPRRIDEFIRDRRAERPENGRTPPSDSRIVKNLGALRRVFRLAIKRGRFTGASPLDRIELPRVRRAPAGHYDLAEIETIVKQLRDPKKPAALPCSRYVLVLFFSGLRRGELCRTRVEQVDLQGGWMRRVDGKTGFRDVPIRPPLAALLKPLVEGKDGSEFLVPAGDARGPREKGNRPRTDLERREGLLNGYFRRFRDLLPENMRERFHAHTLRHSCKTWLMDCDVPAAVRDAITGHSSRSEGGRYEHATPTKVQHYAGVAFDKLQHLVDAVLPATAAAKKA